VIILAVNPYSNTLLVQTTICADQYETIVDLVRFCEDKSSVRRQLVLAMRKLWNQDDPPDRFNIQISEQL